MKRKEMHRKTNSSRAWPRMRLQIPKGTATYCSLYHAENKHRDRSDKRKDPEKTSNPMLNKS
jgi:hypothetical protein